MISKNNDMDMPEKGKKSKVYKVMGTIAMCCIMIPCCFIVGYIVYIMTEALMEMNGQTEGLALVIQLMSVFGVIFSVMVIFNLLYFSSDLDHLLPLPVKPHELVAAKFTHAYLAESVMEFMVLFCGFVGYFFAAKFNVISIITAMLGVVMLPILPMVYCGIFALVVMAFFSRARLLKNVDFMVGVVTLVFAGLFLWSFAQMDSVSVENYIETLKNGDNVFIKIMNHIFFTVPLFLKALENGSALYMLLFVLVNVLCVAVLLLLGNKLYLRGVYLVSSNGRGRSASGKKVTGDGEKLSSPGKAYFKKECRILVRTPAYRKYCVVVNVIWPILVVAMFKIPATADLVNSFRNVFREGHVLSDIIVMIFVVAIAFFATAMNSIAATSFTREGKHISFVKHIPLTYGAQLRVKSAVSMAFSGVTVLISTVLLCILMDCSLPVSIYFVVLGLLGCLICTYIGLVLDSVHPRLSWEDEYGALRGNLNSFFSMAIAIVTALLMCALGGVLFWFTRLSTWAVYTIYLILTVGIVVVLRRYAVWMSKKSIDTDLYSE
jgi:ABC-2 type transport system permease protein